MRRKILRIILFVWCSLFLWGCAGHDHEEGVEALENKSYEEAVSAFERSIESGRYVSDSYRGLGIAYWELKDYEKAEQAFLEVLNRGTEGEKDSMLYYFLGALRMKEEDWDEAINFYSIGKSKQDCRVEMKREMWFNIIVAYEKKEDWENALEELKGYTSAFPDDDMGKKEAMFLENRL